MRLGTKIGVTLTFALASSPAWADKIYQVQLYCASSPAATQVFSTTVKTSGVGTTVVCAGVCDGSYVLIDEVIGAFPQEASTALRAQTAQAEADAANGTGTSLADCGLTSCAVDDLGALGSDAEKYESGDVFDEDNLSTDMRTAVGCLRTAVTASGGSVVWSSAYRPNSYQAHLREVWDTWKRIKDNSTAACSSRKESVRTEFKKHALQESQRPAATSNHSGGEAFDATVKMPDGKPTKDELAKGCGLVRPIPVKDPPHYQRTEFKK